MKYIPLFFSVVLMVFGCSSTMNTKSVTKSVTFEVKCDTFYYRGTDEETGSYYLIEEIVCDTIPKYKYVPNRMG
jgi:uncharacterized protein YceK